MSYSDPLTSSLPPALDREDSYVLRRDPEHGLQIWLDYTGELDGFSYSMMVRDGVWHTEDFSSHVDDLKEEGRVLMAMAREEFGV